MCQNFYEKHFRNLFNFFLLLAPKNNLKCLNFLVFKCFFFLLYLSQSKSEVFNFLADAQRHAASQQLYIFSSFFILNIIFSTFLINFLIKKLNGKKVLMLFPLLLLCRIIFRSLLFYLGIKLKSTLISTIFSSSGFDFFFIKYINIEFYHHFYRGFYRKGFFQ